MQHVVVIVPVDADIQEAQHIAEENGQQRPQGSKALAARHLHFRHHNRDDNRDHAIAECFQATLAMLGMVQEPAVNC